MKTEHWALILSSAASLAMWVVLRNERAQPLGLEEFDRELQRWKPVKPPASSVVKDGAVPIAPQPSKPSAARKWELMTGPSILLQPGRVYAAIIQIKDYRAGHASTSDIVGFLRQQADWEALDVTGEAAQVWQSFPDRKWKDEEGRFWAMGVPSVTKTFDRPAEIARLWSATS